MAVRIKAKRGSQSNVITAITTQGKRRFLIMRFIRLLLSLLLVATVNCSRMKVKQEYNEGFDFSGLKTFSWL